MSSKKLLIGLGNPEPKYSGTRHNVGKDVLKYIKLPSSEVIIETPGETHMNDIGKAVAKLVNFYKIQPVDIAVFYDELDLLAGEYKMTFNKGSKIHNGILSVEEYLGNTNFWHIRIGVRGEEIPSVSVQKSGRDPSKYVLEKLPASDRKKIIEMTEKDLSARLASWIGRSE